MDIAKMSNPLEKLLDRLYKHKLTYYAAGFLLWIHFHLYELENLASKNLIDGIMDLAKYILILFIYEFVFHALFLFVQSSKISDALEKSEQILDVEAFYPSNYADLPKESKYKVRSFITDAIAQIKEQGIPLIICNEDRHYSLYKDFAEGIVKIYGTATQTPYHYALYKNIVEYIMFFRKKDVKRVTILSLNQIQRIIAQNIYYIDNDGLQYDRLPEILWYETVFNEQGKHWWFYDGAHNTFLLSDIHHVRSYTNYAIYLTKDNHRLLLNYFERRDNTGFFLLRCVPPDGAHDETAIKINDFINAIDGNDSRDFYSSFEEMVMEENGNDFEKFRAEEFDFEDNKCLKVGTCYPQRALMLHHGRCCLTR